MKKSSTSALKKLGSIMVAGKKGAKSLDEMPDAREVWDMPHPKKTLLQILHLCAELPEVGEHKIHAKAGAFLGSGMGEDSREGNAALGEIIGEACYAIAERGEKMEGEAMQYTIAAVCPDGVSREFAGVLLEKIATGKTGSQQRTRFFLAVMSFYYYQIARKQAQK